MEKKANKMMMSKLDCCPELAKTPVCDKLSFRYRLPFRPRVGNDNRQTVPVEVVLHFRLERCSGDLVLGDPIYSITMMPGEKVRLYTSDRHTRWSYDSTSSLAYRHETTSEESYFSAAMSRAISDLTINQSGSSSSYFDESWSEGGGGVDFSLFGISIGGSGSGGNYDAQSTSSFASSLSQHAFAASSYVAAGVRAKSSTAIGEVQQRQHAEGESEAHYESSSRMFRNPNRCQAVTYMFHKVNKIQHVKFRLVAIERHVDDPAAPTGAHQRGVIDTSGRVKVLPEAVRATDKKRLDIERMGRTSAFEQQQASTATVGTTGVNMAVRGGFATAGLAAIAAPIHIDLRNAALEAVAGSASHSRRGCERMPG